MDINILLRKAMEVKASDVHITMGVPVIFRLHGKLMPYSEKVLKKEDCAALVKQILSERELKVLNEKGEVDTAYAIETGTRFRVNAFKQRGVISIVLRVINDKIPSLKELKLPGVLTQLCHTKRGLILVTGPTGSGKSTTLASMIDYMNHNLNHHILTIEDPIEYMHKHGTCVVNQRQVGKDTINFANALRAALREDPDVILVGEMRDLETISIALTAAETGHLVMSTLHTIGAAKTIDRIVDTFEPGQQQQVKTQLAGVVQAVISQQILPRANGNGRVAALEVMIANPAIRNLIREGKNHQIQNMLVTGAEEHMQTMDNDLLSLYKNGIIDKKTLFQYAVDMEHVRKEIGEF